MLTRTNNVSSIASSDESVEATIVEQMLEAVIDQRLPPGTKLPEPELCEAFGVGRMRVRRALLLLANQQVVEIQSNKGAFIATPNALQAREVFEARMAIEPYVVKLAVKRASKNDIKRLAKHLKQETLAHKNDDRREAIKLSGLFHVMLAQIANNGVMLRTIKELVSRTSLIIGIYGAPGVANCRDDEHGDIMNAFIAGDQQQAAQLMASHLEHIQSNINLEAQFQKPVNLASVFNEKL